MLDSYQEYKMTSKIYVIKHMRLINSYPIIKKGEGNPEYFVKLHLKIAVDPHLKIAVDPKTRVLRLFSGPPTTKGSHVQI